jgi:hypothetical protein
MMPIITGRTSPKPVDYPENVNAMVAAQYHAAKERFLTATSTVDPLQTEVPPSRSLADMEKQSHTYLNAAWRLHHDMMIIRDGVRALLRPPKG